MKTKPKDTLSVQPERRFTVYTPDSPLRHPWVLVKTMLSDLFASIDLAWRLTIRDISAQYRQTALGYFWAVFPPIVTSITFIILNRANIMQVGLITIPYPVFVITGTIFWQLFVDALNSPLKVLTVNRSLLSKVNFPKEALILSAVGQVLFSFFIKMTLLIIILLIYRVSIGWSALFIVLPIAGFLAIGMLGGLILVPVGMLYQDVQQGLLVATSAMMFFTPVLFPPPSAGLLNKVIGLNPLSPFFVSTRAMLFKGAYTQLNITVIIFLVTLVLLFMGWILYRIALPILIERMDA